MASNDDASKPADRDFYFAAAVAGMIGVAELSWYAIDADGCIAVLSTAGSGPIPKAAVADKDVYFRVDDWFSELAPSYTAEVVNCGTADLSSWEEEARRGLYSFDYKQKPAHEYRLIARPIEPRRVSGLPPDIQRYLLGLQVTDKCFRDIAALRPEDRLEVVARR
jgi:hypothetical protein